MVSTSKLIMMESSRIEIPRIRAGRCNIGKCTNTISSCNSIVCLEININLRKSPGCQNSSIYCRKLTLINDDVTLIERVVSYLILRHYRSRTHWLPPLVCVYIHPLPYWCSWMSHHLYGLEWMRRWRSDSCPKTGTAEARSQLLHRDRYGTKKSWIVWPQSRPTV